LTYIYIFTQVWSLSIEGNPNGYPLGFFVCAGFCGIALLHSFFIRWITIRLNYCPASNNCPTSFVYWLYHPLFISLSVVAFSLSGFWF
jgi:hypothetical protein